ncbi:MAG: hypothetical protein WBQ94_29130 [Terracidiphilus sp.]
MRSYSGTVRKFAALPKSLALGCMFACSMAPAATSSTPPRLDIVNQPDSVLPLDDSLTITVVAHGLPITLKAAVFAVTDDATGKDLSSAFSLPVNCDCPIKAEYKSTISIQVDKKMIAQTVSAKGGLILLYKAGDSPSMVSSARWGFALVRSLPELTVSSRPNIVTRFLPFSPLTLTADKGTACQSYHLSPVLLSIPEDLKVSGDAFTATSEASRPPGVKIDAIFSPEQVCFRTTIPGEYTELKARFHLDDPSIKKPVDFDADLRVKDHWAWRGFAALLATFPALALIYWTTTIRRRILNRNQRDEVANRLAAFLASNPALGNHDSVVFVRQMILDSTVEDKTGDFDASVQSLSSATSRLDQLFASPPTASIPVAQSGQAIRILNPASCIVSGQKISFVIGQPNTNWPANGGTYEWTLANSRGSTIASRKGVELKRFDHSFDSAGPFVVTVTVDGANPESRDFDVLAELPASIIEQFKIVQMSMVVITFLVAAGTAYVSTQDASTFGTFGDYFKLIANSFGVSGGAGGVATVLSAVRGR